ncbi:PREDICTED: uncharacterized protein LOC108551694 [Eufriesea mexicana]|uniref:uncharacterized protein LOC108551694 n=1 Tax=Eufriesea mexicana TaxID=516756 RepID=UPI00083C05F4|nr:PREDICTED: uncharacterized protein LOC108551694 [Eufriesea mexicana]
MSERRDSTCRKHELPKSLQGTEDAEFVWSMITERFPNAAPLLCEMEAVIDRAEDLLQQLRTPCREIETSTSFCTQDSEESTVMISAKGSLTTESNVESDIVSKNVAEIQVSESSIYEEEINLNSQSGNSVNKEQNNGSQSSDSFITNPSYTTKKHFSDASASLNIETNTDQIKKMHSLEEWAKIVDNAMREDTGEVQSVKKTINMFEKRINSKEIEIENYKNEESCIILHRQETCPDDSVGDSTMEIDSDRNLKNQTPIPTMDNVLNVSIKGSGDESLSKIVTQRTPLSVLEVYAKRCKVPIEYEYTTDSSHRHKSNIYVIRGNFAGFAATCRGLTKEATKNDLAAKILKMIANQQMEDKKPDTLADLTKTELLEIINLGGDDLRETAQRKLYELCLEKGDSVPTYSVEKVKTYQGLTYVATCSALGYTSEGRGVRECVAKKAAADELYHQYCENKKQD